MQKIKRKQKENTEKIKQTRQHLSRVGSKQQRSAVCSSLLFAIRRKPSGASRLGQRSVLLGTARDLCSMFLGGRFIHYRANVSGISREREKERRERLREKGEERQGEKEREGGSAAFSRLQLPTVCHQAQAIRRPSLRPEEHATKRRTRLILYVPRRPVRSLSSSVSVSASREEGRRRGEGETRLGGAQGLP